MIRSVSAVLVLLATAVQAEAPRVITDIAPVHSLVAQVMGDVGTPDLIIAPGGDAHHLSLRPSDARNLSQARVVVWVGSALTPWLTAPIETLAPQAATLTLLNVPGWTPIPLSGSDGHDHGHDKEHGDDHDGADNQQLEVVDEDRIDPHAWLDPEVAMFWLRAIRDTLSTTDPDNATAYADNTSRALAGLAALRDDITATLTDVPSGTWLAPHAAFGYFEQRFDIASAGAIADNDDAAPGPAHLAELRDLIKKGEVTCVISQTGAATDYAKVLGADTAARTAVMDDTGLTFTPGPALYGDLLSGIAAALKGCIAP